MRVAFFQFYPATLWTPGGGETQMLQTLQALKRLGVEVELFDVWCPRRDFDILHVFGSTYQLSDLVVTAKRLGFKVVVSPIAYSLKPAWAWAAWKYIDRLMPVATTYTYRRRIYEAADVLLPGSAAEALQLQRFWSVPRAKMVVVYNAADCRFAEAEPDLFYRKYGIKDYVLMVSRISNRKGQLRLMRAMDGLGIDLVFIGAPDPEDMGYFDSFRTECKKRQWVHYIGSLPHGSDLLASAYAGARVHALPSFGEFPGLVNLEAGLAGCNVVAGDSQPTREHLGDAAYYCNPRSVASIRKAVIRAYNCPRDGRLRNRLLAGFTWNHVATKIVRVYQNLLQGRHPADPGS